MDNTSEYKEYSTQPSLDQHFYWLAFKNMVYGTLIDTVSSLHPFQYVTELREELGEQIFLMNWFEISEDEYVYYKDKCIMPR